ncbi:protein of unknown function [Cupriavidus taiwanensis]|uniref:Uncharacterized protein n=1 Tax=Cupriavidus taiwanensis TaxID=164546 RepID=A0A375FSL2_9BURK|nr:protein of unknown function [Cupriavidus taiwanensis]SPC06192.1 hypothetical protein CBM2594_A10154 [Cupriavidus taiwanensis]SPC10134.1 hypothetical protein CT19431_240019 [Cupriavidus taiwanensis]SPD38225.1 protein of unknown function [Cupriavidus taiwanensis]
MSQTSPKWGNAPQQGYHTLKLCIRNIVKSITYTRCNYRLRILYSGLLRDTPIRTASTEGRKQETPSCRRQRGQQ